MDKHNFALIIALLLVLAGCGQPPKTEPNPFLYGGDTPLPTVDPYNTASTDIVAHFLEPAPAGYAWEYERDWDDSIVSKCLVNVREKGGAVDLAVHCHLRSYEPPRGYWWTGESKTPATGGQKIVVRSCIQRLGCTYGKVPNSRECITPQ